MTRLTVSAILGTLTVMFSACQEAKQQPVAQGPRPVSPNSVELTEQPTLGPDEFAEETQGTGDDQTRPNDVSAADIGGHDLTERLERLRPQAGARPGAAATRARELFTGKLWAAQAQAGPGEFVVSEAVWNSAVQVYGEAVRNDPYYAAELLGDDNIPSEIRGELVKAYVEFAVPTGLDGAAARIRLIPEKDTSDSAAWILAERMAQGKSEEELARILARADLFGPDVAPQVASSIFSERKKQR